MPATPAQPDNDVSFTFRLPRSVKDRLNHHGQKNGGGAAKLARHAITALVKLLDQQETSAP